jgi:hypothetical protein
MTFGLMAGEVSDQSCAGNANAAALVPADRNH